MKKTTTLFLILLNLISCSEKNKENEKIVDEIPIESQSITADTLEKNLEKNLPDTLNIVAVGDIMIGSAYPSKSYLPKDDGKESFSEVKDFLKGDVVFGNLEGVLLNSGDSYKCVDKEPNLCYAFRMPERYAKTIREAGFNLLSTANNHTGDFGKLGRENTAKVLEENGFHFAGAKETPFDIFEINSVKYGFCAFAPNKNMMALNNISEAKKLVEKLKKETNIVIVSFHGGAEGSEYTRVPKTAEIFYGENRGNVHHFAHSVIDAGADIVLGHGPHITRAAELYKGKFIAYSLGNFNTYGKFSLIGKKGIAPLLDIKLDKNGNFLYANVISTKQTKTNGLQLDEKQQAFGEMKRLTKLDFPDTELDFEEEGKIKRKRKPRL